MNKQSQWLFEAPISLQATDYNNPYTSLELEDEWENTDDTALNNFSDDDARTEIILAIRDGYRNENYLTNRIFRCSFPNEQPKKSDPKWTRIRDDLVRPLLRNPVMKSRDYSMARDLTFEFELPEAEMEDAGERQMEVVKPLPNTPVGRVLAKMGVKHLIIEKPPLLHPAHWVRGLSGFEVHCARHRQINVVFGLFDQQRKSLAWYLFSSTVDPSSKLACKRSGSTPILKEPFGVSISVATFTPRLQKSQIDISELVRDAKSPFATMTLDTKTSNTFISCSLDNLNTKSNGLVHLAFGLRKVSEPSRANVAIPGKLFFLSVEPFDDEKFRNDRFLDLWSPQRIAEGKAISNFRS